MAEPEDFTAEVTFYYKGFSLSSPDLAVEAGLLEGTATHHQPRVGDTITTADQLDALPLGALVLDKMQDPAFHAFGGQWQYHESQLLTVNYIAKHYAPFTVLYVPGEWEHGREAEEG